MSILLPLPVFQMLLLLGLLGLFGVGGASTAHPGGGDAHALQLPWLGMAPIGREDRRSICATLCIAGLGGEGCGAPCATLTPRNITQSGGGDAPIDTFGGRGGKTRRDACPLLCTYQLGEPLCACSEELGGSGGGGIGPAGPAGVNRNSASIEIDYHRICGYFCFEHRYHIYGCPQCGVYRMQDLDRRVRPTEMDIDWEEWCREQCAVGQGGAACDCDLPLPLPMNIKAEADD